MIHHCNTSNDYTNLCLLFLYHYHYPNPYPDITVMIRYLHDHHEGVYDIFINFLFFQCHSQYTSLDSEYCHLLLPRYVIYALHLLLLLPMPHEDQDMLSYLLTKNSAFILFLFITFLQSTLSSVFLLTTSRME